MGRISRPTPVMTTRLDSLILNPTWNVPHKIMVEDILPITKRDHTYLTRHHIDILESWQSEQTLDPEKIDWKSVNPKTFPTECGNSPAIRMRWGFTNSTRRTSGRSICMTLRVNICSTTQPEPLAQVASGLNMPINSQRLCWKRKVLTT